MDYKNSKAERDTVTRDMRLFLEGTDNTFETIAIIAKRANQIGAEVKEELNDKLAEFATSSDNLEEIFENREQIEISKFYEKLPKPVSVAVDEYLDDKIYYRNPVKEEAAAAAVEEAEKD
ncbi:MAG: DNA-directed RNA polymerase subunit omega [Flavobacteriales bacterium]|nr:DNA-directed RNA polymerase subunit omega [Flavobacteriales bacterium]